MGTLLRLLRVLCNLSPSSGHELWDGFFHLIRVPVSSVGNILKKPDIIQTIRKEHFLKGHD